MLPVVNGSKENEEFFKYTPYGKLDLGIVNPDAAKEIESGCTYYLDLTKAD